MAEDPNFWADLLKGASGDFLGGLCATIFWFLVLLFFEWRGEQRRVKEKLAAIILELAKLRTALEEVVAGGVLYSTKGGATITALVRMPPRVEGDVALEPLLANVETSLARVDSMIMRLEAEESGLAAALRGNEETRLEIQGRLKSAANTAIQHITALENRLVRR